MRIVADTNTVVSGLLWSGPPQEIINAARIRVAGVSAPEIVADYGHLAKVVTPAEIRPSVTGDPDDDHVLACALAAGAELVVSGDKRLRNLKTYHGIPIVTAAEALTRLPEGA